MILSQLIILSGVLSIPITFAIFWAVRYVASRSPNIKHWPPNYWW